MKIFKLGKDKKLSKKNRDEVVLLLNKGGTVVVPTDTSYGLAALVTNKKAYDKVYQIKHRPHWKTFSMAVRGKSQALKYGKFSDQANRIWQTFMPGALTLVVNENPGLVDHLRNRDRTVSFRFVPTPAVNQLLKKLEAPFTITSANKSGEPDLYSYEDLLKQYKNDILPTAFIDAGELPQKPPSTVVRCTKEKGIEILRKGSISLKKINEAIKK